MIETFLKHRPLVYSIVNRMRSNTFKYKTYIDWDEVEQVGMIALYNAVNNYDSSKGSFKSYAITAIERSVLRQLDFDRVVETYSDIAEAYNIPGTLDIKDDCDFTSSKKRIANIIDKLPVTNKTKSILKLALDNKSAKDIANI